MFYRNRRQERRRRLRLHQCLISRMINQQGRSITVLTMRRRLLVEYLIEIGRRRGR
jgi:hypothetical protein